MASVVTRSTKHFQFEFVRLAARCSATAVFNTSRQADKIQNVPMHAKTRSMSTVYQELASVTRAPVHEAKSLHPNFYTNDDYAKAERESVFGQNWFAAAHAAELPILAMSRLLMWEAAPIY